MNKLTFLISVFCATALTACFPQPEPPPSPDKTKTVGEVLEGESPSDSETEGPQDSQSESDTPPASLSEESLKTLMAEQDTIKKKCITHNFYEGYEKTFNLYGKVCLNNTRLVIKTAGEGQPVSTSYAIKDQDGTGGLRLEGDVKDVNQFHIVPYNIVQGDGHDQVIPYLIDFLPEKEEFKGALNSRYHIIFELKGDYLVLFKASKNLKNIPYTERTSMERDKDGKYKKDEDGFYRAPFIGYPVKYCKAVQDKNPSTGKPKNTFSPDCGSEHTRADAAKDIEYINIGAKKTYKYGQNKVDLFPEHYFAEKEQWFFSAGFVEGSGEVGHLSPFTAHLIKMRRTPEAFEFIDVSGTVDERNRKAKGKLPIKWLDYEWAQKDDFIFESFGERPSTTKNDVNRPYVKIDFSQIQSILSIQTPGLIITSGELIDLLITPDYFSYVFRLTARDGQQAKYKTSLLRKSAVNKKGFITKQWFREDHNHIFGFLNIEPQTVIGQGEISEVHLTKNINLIRFNTSAKETVIKWHFSKNTPKDEFYRDVARQAVEIWNQAFQYITKDTGKKIEVVLAEEEGDKDLGDLRYNIINLIKTKEAATRVGGILFGVAPSYVHADTGQIIGTTSNLVINNIEGEFIDRVRSYIRYEIYQSDKNKKYAPEKNEIHVVSPYMRSKITKQCSDKVGPVNINDFIQSKKGITLNKREDLGDKDIVVACARRLARENVLSTLLHEMGHSFGLGHNFKGSLDKDNYWTSLDEIQKIFPLADKEPAKFSSVMDYWLLAENPYPQVLGKYDLAALKFLYLDRLEDKEKGKPDIIWEIPTEKSLQKKLTDDTAVLSQKKKYLHCSDNLHNPLMGGQTINIPGQSIRIYTFNTNVEDFLCIQRDYGSNPEEIVSAFIDSFKRKFNISIHNYEQTGNLRAPSILLFRIMSFYRKWLNVRDKYLRAIGEENKTNYIIGDQESLKVYKDTIESGKKDSEYASYYPVREKAFDFITDFMFLRTMKCQVESKETKESFVLELDLIKKVIRSRHGQALYVEDCKSPHIQEFLERNNLNLTGQNGLADFVSYYTEGPQADWKDLTAFSEIFHNLRQYTMMTVQADHIDLMPRLENTHPVDPISAYILAGFMEEPDFFDRFRKKLESRYFDTEMSVAEGLNAYRYKLKIMTNMQRILTTPFELKIWRSNVNYFASKWYPIGTDRNSFQKSVLDHLKTGGDIEETEVPFLATAYQDYLESGKEDIQGFQSYLIQREDTLDLSDTLQGFYAPYIDGNLADRMIVRYNQNLKKMEDIESAARSEGRDMGELEDIFFKKLENQNVFLQQLL